MILSISFFQLRQSLSARKGLQEKDGIPQGSVLRPLLFTLHLNNLGQKLLNILISTLMTVSHPAEAAHHLQFTADPHQEHQHLLGKPEQLTN